MSVGLATLVARLQAAVPARDGVPSAEQYSQCVEDAVADLGAARPLTRVASLQITAGQASYELPADWQRTIRLGGLTAGGDGVVISSDGLIPVGAGFAERLTYAGQTLTISPTPSYTLARELVYAAGYLLDEHEAYPALAADTARLVMLKAQSLALDLQANAAAQRAWKYQQGDESVDKTGLAKALREQADAQEKAYQTALRQTVQPYGTRG
jgi:hypothetical protein